jgi:hypothetical protein
VHTIDKEEDLSYRKALLVGFWQCDAHDPRRES